jgi:hypothetical protein
MPSTSSAQHRAMEAAAHGKSILGIPKSVGRDFARADGDKSFAEGGPVDDTPDENQFQAARARDKAAQTVAAPYNKGGAGLKSSTPPAVKNPPWAQSASNFAHGGLAEHRQLAKQKTAHFVMGGNVPMPPTMGVSSAYPPPPGHRTEGPRNYGKKVS